MELFLFLGSLFLFLALGIPDLRGLDSVCSRLDVAFRTVGSDDDCLVHGRRG